VCDVKIRVESQVKTLRLWPLMTLLSRTADELYRSDCDGVLSLDSQSSSRVSYLLYTRHVFSWVRNEVTNDTDYASEQITYTLCLEKRHSCCTL